MPVVKTRHVRDGIILTEDEREYDYGTVEDFVDQHKWAGASEVDYVVDDSGAFVRLTLRLGHITVIREYWP